MIDDREDFVTTTVSFLQEQGYRLITAGDGQKGLEKAVEEKPDLIILDVDLPKINGFEVCRALKEDITTRFIPIIMLSKTYTEMISKLTGLKIGADEYLNKPFDPEELIIRIEKLIQNTKEFIAIQPLTHLPGSASFETRVRNKIHNGEKFSICYLDIDNFKAYNDKYGYMKGNDVIVFIGDLLYRISKKERDVTIGHIGGDDFILAMPSERVDNICKEITETFDQNVHKFYTEMDYRKKYIVTKDRQGNYHKFPLLRISIEAASSEKRGIQNYEEIISVLVEMKNYIKSLPERTGSTYIKDRRKG